MPGIIEGQNSQHVPDSRSREVRAYLGKLLLTQHFSAASRRGQLLEYLVQHTLAGDADKINEYAIGLDVFRKPASFDPRIESVVRTEFSRLRQRLKDYYADEGQRDTIAIDFPPRSYVANFDFRDAISIAEPTAAPRLVEIKAKPARPVSRNGAVLVVTVLAALALAATMLWRQHTSHLLPKQAISAIVVLPFQNYSPDHQDDYIADGMTEELTNDLAQWHDLRVVARTSAFAFKGKGEDVRQIGQQLSVDTVLEGSFTRQGDHVRITAQLNRTADGYHLWSKSYESQDKDLLAVQEEVATSITDAIRQLRGGTPPVIHAETSSPQAHDLYMQGEYQYNLRTPQSLEKAIQLFNQAIAVDPSFARAYLAIGYAELALSSLTVETNAEARPRVRAAAQKAIELDPNLGEAHGLLALVECMWEWNWSQAEAEFQRALELGASSETRTRYGWALAAHGRFNEAHKQTHVAAEEDPLSETPPFDDFFAYNFERDVTGEKKALRQMLQISPSFFGGHALGVVAAVQQHDCVTAHAEADWLEKTYPTIPGTQSTRAFAAACSNDKAQVLSLLRKMAAMHAPFYQAAIAYALLHDKENAIDQLRRSADAHEGQIIYLKYDPFFDEIRSDPRYVELEKLVGVF
jgi:serine/threonine-protein kinase